MPESYRLYFNDLIGSMVLSLSSSAGTMFKDNSINIVSRIPNLLLIMLLTLISTFFFIADKELISDSIKKHTPEIISKNFVKVRKGILKALTGYVKAQGIIMCITGTIAIIILTVLNYEYAMLVAIIIALIDALPIFGSGFVLWPWIALSFFSSNYKMAVGLLILYGAILFSRQIAEPKVLGSQIGMHPLLTLMSMYVGLKIFGVFGFIIGPVTVIIIKTLLFAEKEKPPTGPETIETQ
jgi:sporulation integral membrane protein YtvI